MMKSRILAAIVISLPGISVSHGERVLAQPAFIQEVTADWELTNATIEGTVATSGLKELGEEKIRDEFLAAAAKMSQRPVRRQPRSIRPSGDITSEPVMAPLSDLVQSLIGGANSASSMLIVVRVSSGESLHIRPDLYGSPEQAEKELGQKLIWIKRNSAASGVANIEMRPQASRSLGMN